MKPEMLEDKILEYLEGDLSPAEEKELLAAVASDPEAKALFEDYQRQERGLAAYYGAQAKAAQAKARPSLAGASVVALSPAAAPRRAAVWLLAAAACFALVMAGTATWLFRGREREAIGTVLAVAGRPQALVEQHLVNLASNASIAGGARWLKTTAASYMEVALSSGLGKFEMNSNSSVSVANSPKRSDLSLERGEVIVDASAAGKSGGAVRVKTPHLEATSSNGVFSVVRGLRGSEVSAVSGDVEVSQGGARKQLRSGESFSSLGLRTVSVSERVSWSRHSDVMLASLGGDGKNRSSEYHRARSGAPESPAASSTDQVADSAAIASVADRPRRAAMLTGPRLSATDLLSSDTLALIEIPSIPALLAPTGSTNLADLLTVENADRIGASIGGATNISDEELVEAIETMESILSNEDLRTVAGALTASAAFGVTTHGPLLVADVRANAAGVAAVIEGRVEPTLEAQCDGCAEHPRAAVAGGFLILGLGGPALDESLAAASANHATAFGASPFVSDLRSAVGGSVITSAVDVAAARGAVSASGNAEFAGKFFRRSGLDNMRYVIAATDFGDQANNQALRATFDGPRHGTVGWLAEPGAMGGLKFFSADTHAVAAMKIKRPNEMLAEVLSWMAEDGHAGQIPEADSALVANLAATLGNEVVFGLDNPVLPIPNAKVAIEVVDPVGFHDAMLAIIDRVWAVSTPATQVDVQAGTYRDRTVVNFTYPGVPAGLSYAIVDDFVVVAPGRPFVENAIDTALDGRSLDREYAFNEALPAMSGSQTSMLVYSGMKGDLGSIGPLVAQFAPADSPIDFASLATGAEAKGGIFYAIAGADSVDFYAEGVRVGDFQTSGFLPAVADWMAGR